MPELVSPLAVAANDAGAANLICGWLEDRPDLTLRVVADGPARLIVQRHFPGLEFCPTVDEALAGARMLLSGTSWVSTLEHDARKRARSVGVPSIGVIDHWINYAERFERDGEIVLPDTIWVGDEYALAIARGVFPGVEIEQRPNRYLEREVAEVRRAAVPAADGRTHILYVLEPIRAEWARHAPEPGEFQALDYFFTVLPRLTSSPLEIRLRPHPHDPPGKYDTWAARQKRHPVRIDNGGALSAAIAWADWVVGCETFAMVIALHAGKRVSSSLPPWSPPCRLPFPAIESLKTLSS